MSGPYFETWERENLVQFAREVYEKLQRQEEELQELRWAKQEKSSLADALYELMKEETAAEREACAKVAESYEPRCDSCPSGVANAIRARGEKT